MGTSADELRQVQCAGRVHKTISETLGPAGSRVGDDAGRFSLAIAGMSRYRSFAAWGLGGRDLAQEGLGPKGALL